MTTNYKCHGCIWKDIYTNDAVSYPICKRKWDMTEAMNECCKPGSCPHHMTQKEADKIVDTFNGG